MQSHILSALCAVFWMIEGKLMANIRSPWKEMKVKIQDIVGTWPLSTSKKVVYPKSGRKKNDYYKTKEIS